MQQVELKATARGGTGRVLAKKLRRTGGVPAVLYGPRTKPISLQVEEKALGRLIKRGTSANLFVELQLDEGGKSAKRLSLLQEIQRHPTSDQILHVDFREISLTEKLTTTVTVVPRGEAIGVKEGGTLNSVLHELMVRCLPKDLPDYLEVDVTKLAIGQSINIGAIIPPPGVELVATDKTAAVFALVAPMAEEVAATTAEAAPGEPEVIKEKKVEGEEAAAGEAKGEAKKGEAKPAAGKAEAKPAAGAKAEAKPAAPVKK